MEVIGKYYIEHDRDEFDAYLKLIKILKENQKEVGFKKMQFPDDVVEYIDGAYIDMGYEET